MDMPQQPGQPAMRPMNPAEPGEQAAEPAFKICVAGMADGSLSVYMDGAEGEGQSVPDIGGALRAVLDLYKQAAAASGETGNEFDEGYAGAGGTKPAAAAMPGMRGA